MKLGKRLWAVTLVIALMASMTGCGGTKNETVPAVAETGKSADTPGAGSEAGSEAAKPESAAGEPAGEAGQAAQPTGYPGGTVSLVVPAAAGAANDLVTRALNDALDLGGNVVIENMAGASQTIGSAEVAKRDADGLSMLTCANVGMLLMPLTTQLTYDKDDFRHIAMITSPLTMVICVKSGSGIETGEDWAKRVTNGESFTYSHPAGAGGLGQLAATDFLGQMGSASGQFIAYNGSAEVMTALLNGEIDWAIIDEGDAAAKVNSGEMKALYLIAQEPSEHCQEILPGVPCLSEQKVANLDLYAGYKWIAVRGDTPEEVVAWMKQQLNTAIQSSEYQGWLETAGYGPVREYSEEEITEILNNASELYVKSFEQLGMTK